MAFIPALMENVKAKPLIAQIIAGLHKLLHDMLDVNVGKEFVSTMVFEYSVRT